MKQGGTFLEGVNLSVEVVLDPPKVLVDVTSCPALERATPFKNGAREEDRSWTFT